MWPLLLFLCTVWQVELSFISSTYTDRHVSGTNRTNNNICEVSKIYLKMTLLYLTPLHMASRFHDTDSTRLNAEHANCLQIMRKRRGRSCISNKPRSQNTADPSYPRKIKDRREGSIMSWIDTSSIQNDDNLAPLSNLPNYNTLSLFLSLKSSPQKNKTVKNLSLSLSFRLSLSVASNVHVNIHPTPTTTPFNPV